MMFSVAVLFILMARITFGSTQTALYRLFKEEQKGYYLYKLLGIVPDGFIDRYSRTVIEQYSGYKLISLVDTESIIRDNYFLIESEVSHSRLLKAYPLDLLPSNKKRIEPTWKTHVSYLVDTDVFNDYIKAHNFNSKKEIMKKYCFLFSHPQIVNSYKIINDAGDIKLLLKQHPLDRVEYFNRLGFELINAEEFNLLHMENTVYCWIYNKGLVKFKFSFDKNMNVECVESEIMGLFGNEVSTCC